MPPELPPPSSWAPSFPPQAAFGGAPIYSAGGEALLVSVMNSAAGVTVKVTGRTLALGNDRPSPFEKTLIPATDRSVSTTIIPIPDGWFLSAQAIVSAGTPATGQTFVKLSLIHGTTSTSPELWTLAADYATAKQAVSYPGAGIVDPTDTAGALRSITGTIPGVGVDISEVVPTGARVELIAFAATLTASATVANRQVQLTIDDGANTYFRNSMNVNQTASQAPNYEWVQGFGNPSISQIFALTSIVPFNNRLGSGHRIRTVTGALQAGDQWSAPQYLWREWIEGN
jgi:hypothetical protein